MESINKAIRQSVLDGETSMKYLSFQIDDQYYGISINDVIEIVQIQPATGLPEQPPYIKGIINLRGRVVPLIDVSIRFGKSEKGYTDRTCIIIVDIEGMSAGLIVDAVEEVLDIDASLITPPPSLSAESSARYVTGIGKLDKYMILLLNSRLLLPNVDTGMLEQAAI